VALALVGRRDDREDRVHAAVDRIRVIEVADGLIVIRLVEILLATQEDGVRPIDVALADFRGVAGRRIARGLLREGRDRDCGKTERDGKERLTDGTEHCALESAPYHKKSGRFTKARARARRASTARFPSLPLPSLPLPSLPLPSLPPPSLPPPSLRLGRVGCRYGAWMPGSAAAASGV